ncbi:MAG: diaminopimelate decarboxylase [Sporolactobacillus sp.]
MEQNEKGHLIIGGCDAVKLAETYGTPLYVYDVSMIRQNINAFKQAFASHPKINWQIAYASKAFSSTAMVQLIKEEGLSLDVVSGGELYTALQAGMPAKNIHFHGNNKSDDELAFALDSNIGLIVVDNFYELERLEELCARCGQTMDILLRITPGVEAHTHEFIMTGQSDTKFGFNLEGGMADQAVRQAMSAEHLSLKGLHCHIGSQIFETEGYARAIANIYAAIEKWIADPGFIPAVMNVGGGFGIQYTKRDRPLPVSAYVDRIVAAVEAESVRLHIDTPSIWVEPGRRIVGEAGMTLYTVGAIKTIPGVRTYMSVDGGMTDNIRPALYGAMYRAICANRVGEPSDTDYTIAGKCCETGDLLIKGAMLPAACTSGDTLAVCATGAYGYAMASHYNRLPNPAVVFVEDGEATVVVRRESYADLTRFDVPLKTKLAHEG